MVDQNLYNIVEGIAIFFLGWWVNTVWKAVRDLETADKSLMTRVSEVEVLVAGEYVKTERFDLAINAVFAKLDRIEDKLDEKVDK